MESRAELVQRVELYKRNSERIREEQQGWVAEVKRLREAFKALITLFPEQFASYVHEDDGYVYRQVPGDGVYYDVAQLEMDLLAEAKDQQQTKADEARWQRLFGTQED